MDFLSKCNWFKKMTPLPKSIQLSLNNFIIKTGNVKHCPHDADICASFALLLASRRLLWTGKPDIHKARTALAFAMAMGFQCSSDTLISVRKTKYIIDIPNTNLGCRHIFERDHMWKVTPVNTEWGGIELGIFKPIFLKPCFVSKISTPNFQYIVYHGLSLFLMVYHSLP